MSTRTVRTPETDSERATLERILVESFGTDGLPWSTWMARIGHENLRVVTEDGAIRGGMGFYPFAQWWGGQRLPLFGYAGVGVAPEARGTGLARAFLVETLREAREKETPLCALYASSVAVYRSIGFEQAGTTQRWSAPISSLPRGDHALSCAPFDPDTDRSLRGLYEARARGWSGHLDRSEAMWERIARPYEGIARGYRFGPAEAPEGYVVYSHQAEQHLHFAIVIRDLVLATPAAARRCAALLGDLRSLATDVRWLGCSSDPLVSLLPEQTARPIEHGRWMLRIVDPARALSMRGYVRDGEARVRVRDAIFGDTCLALRVTQGRAEVTPVAAADLTLDTRALAALYTGFAHPSTLALMGLVEGPREELDALARLFVDREPWLCDWF